MRLWLTSRFLLPRRQESIPLVNRALAEFASPSDAYLRLLSSFYAPRTPPSVQKKRSSPGANGVAPACADRGRLLLKSSRSSTLESLLNFGDGYRGSRPPNEDKELLDVPSDVWQLLREYDVPAKLMSVYRVHIQTAQTTSEEVHLALHGRQATHVAAMLSDPPLKLDVPEEVGLWLISEGPNGLRLKDILKRRGALVKPSNDNKSVLLVGSSKATLAAKHVIDELCIEEFDINDFVGFYLINNRAYHQKRLSIETDALVSTAPVVGATKWKAVAVGPVENVKRLRRKIDALHVERRRIPRAVCIWLGNKSEGANSSRSILLDRKFDTCTDTWPLKDDSDPSRMVDLVVVGERKEDVGKVLAIIDRLHVKRRRISQAVRSWLAITSKGANCARATNIERKLDTSIAMGPLSDNADPARMMDLIVVGQREENVDQVLAVVDSIVVEKVAITGLQAEFWMGHEEEQNRNPLRQKIERTTGTSIAVDFAERCLHVAGRPDCVRAALEEISKTQHIALRTCVVSLAMANYVDRTGRAYENDDRQIRLRPDDTRPGAWELRRLYRMDAEGDDTKVDSADEDLMRKLDLDETVLELPMWAQVLSSHCLKMEKATGTGIGFSTDAINGRVLVAIAGSRSTVKRGVNEVIRRIERNEWYQEGDVWLRRIQGHPVDLAGFKRMGDARPVDVRLCKEPFLWERLTRERWCYAGGPRGGPLPKRFCRPSV